MPNITFPHKILIFNLQEVRLPEAATKLALN